MNEHKIRAAGRTGLADVIVAAELALGAAFERRGGLRLRHAWIAAVPIVIVNYVAFRAQLRFWHAHLGPGDAVLVSVALESIAIYLAWLSHCALLARDSALRLRLSAYGTALLIGVLNYSHYMLPGWRPTVAAVTFGGMSAISPWLWSAYSRRENRDALKLDGLIEDHAVRLGATRWLWHAWRCMIVMWKATWPGVTRPAEAIVLYVSRRERKAGAAGARRRVPRQDTEGPRPARAARALAPVPAAELARLSSAEQALALELSGLAGGLPSARELARERRISRPSAGKVLAAVRAGANGEGGHGDRDGS